MKIRLAPPDPSWPDAFQTAYGEIADRVGSTRFAGFEHVGSTAVPELAAKPVIDMVAAVHDLADVEAIAQEISELGYITWHSTPGRRTLQRRDASGDATEHLHIVALDSREWHR